MYSEGGGEDMGKIRRNLKLRYHDVIFRREIPITTIIIAFYILFHLTFSQSFFYRYTFH